MTIRSFPDVPDSRTEMFDIIDEESQGEPLRSFRVILIASFLTSTVLAVSDWRSKVPESDRTRQNPIASTPESLSAGKGIYTDKCAKCHGANGEGKGNHPSLQTRKVHSASAGELEWLIAHGNRWHGMPGFGDLSQEQRWQLVSLPTAPN